MLDFTNTTESKPKQKDVIRIKTDRWVNANGELVIQKNIRQLRRMSVTEYGCYMFEEEINQVGTDCLDSSTPELESLEDGVYEMYPKHISREWESGYICDVEWGFKKL